MQNKIQNGNFHLFIIFISVLLTLVILLLNFKPIIVSLQSDCESFNDTDPVVIQLPDSYFERGTRANNTSSESDFRISNSTILDNNTGSQNSTSSTESMIWWTFRGNHANTGTTTDSGIPLSNDTLWVYDANNAIKTSPAVVDSRVYFGTSNGTVICLSQANGTELWRKTLEMQTIDYSSPCINGERLIIGTLENRIFCLNSSTGNIIWNISTDGEIHSSPKIQNEMVFITSYDAKIYSFNLTTGKEIWNHSTSGWIHTSPAIWDGKIFYGGCDGLLHANYIGNGSSAWEFNTDNYVVTSPAVHSGRIFFATRDGHVYCLNAKSGELLWDDTINGIIESSPAVSDEQVVIADKNGKIHCYDKMTGELIWNFQTKGEIYSSPAIAENKLVVGSNDQHIYCLNLSSGEPHWNFTTGKMVESSPALAYNRVFIGSDDGKLYCFGKKPSISILTPKYLQEFNTSNIELNGKASTDAGSIKYIEARINSGSWLMTNGTTNWNITLNFSNLENGLHILSCRASDGVTYSRIASINIILNLTNLTQNETPERSIPEVSLIGLLPQQNVISSMLTIHGNASVANGTIKYVEVEIDSGSWMMANGTSNWNINLNLSNLEDGLHLISYRSFDGITYSEVMSINISLNLTLEDGILPDGGGETNGTESQDNEEEFTISPFALSVIIITTFLIIIIAIVIYGRRNRIKKNNF